MEQVETPSQIQPQVIQPDLKTKVMDFVMKNKYIVVGLVVVLILLYLYKKNKLPFFSKKPEEKVEEKKVEEKIEEKVVEEKIEEKVVEEKQDNNILDIHKDYYIIDENGHKARINLKELIQLHNTNLILSHHNQKLQLQVQELQHEILQSKKPKSRKIEHPKKPVVELESDSDDVTTENMDELKRELEQLERENKKALE